MNFQKLLQLEGALIEKKKGEYVFMQGEADKSLYFVESGLLKAYYISDDGKEFIKSFIVPNNTIGSLASIYLDNNCTFSLVCLEPSLLRKIPFESILKHAKKDIEIANNMIETLLNFAIKKEKREFEFLCLSAEERFCSLLETSPMLLDKVTQNDLARYLGVTPVGLSRIKKRVYSHARDS